MGCIFCEIAKGDIPCNKVYEDERIIAFLDIAPVSIGHTLVIPKEHVEKIYELNETSASALIKTLIRVSKAISEAFCADFNVLNNNGEKAGQAVKHLHFHIIPRRGDIGEFSYRWPAQKYGDGEDKEILKKIIEKL